ncbi:hypothetical protein BABINDRAFT_162975, partial [Babjeviella inositovora NRRL Y-12698]
MSQNIEDIDDPSVREQIFVHDIYNHIAPHFSQTRYKPWPIVEDFLLTRSKGSVGIDVGCGNGKYLVVNKDIFIVGSDRSSGLIDQASQINRRGHNDILVSDGMRLPHHENLFDFGISIAVIHHFSTDERRVAAIKHILLKLRSGGEVLIYCWALEQEKSRRGYKEGDPQDVLVPWILQANKKAEKKVRPQRQKKQRPMAGSLESGPVEEPLREPALEEKEGVPETKMRYYHLYKKG